MRIEYLSVAVENIKHRRIRSWLTILGIFIGIAAVVGLISLSQGMNAAIAQQFEMLGADTITIMPGRLGPAAGYGSKPFTNDDVKIIESVRGVGTVVPMIYRTQEVKFRGESRLTFVIGVPADEIESVVFDLSGLHITKGRMPSETDKYGLIAGKMIEDDFFKDDVSVGDKIQIAGSDFKVRGFLSEVGNPTDDTQIYIHLDTAREIFDEPDKVDAIFLQVRSGADVEKVAKDIKEELKDARGQEDFSVLTSAQLSETVGAVLGIVQLVFIGIASISLLVGGVGIMNTMYTSVRERTREIGVMKAIGARNSDIMSIFLFESGVLGLVGGAIGIALGFVLSKSVEMIAHNAGYMILKASINPELILLGLGFSFGVGVLSGVLPARSAAKMNPVDALRYE
ncbi:MAG: ABC transporter permease [Candidatus Aenigmatarchaeota archaeon]